MAGSASPPIRALGATLALAVVLAGACSCGVALADGLRAPDPPKPPGAAGGDYSATLEQCMTAAIASERSATFTGQMVAGAGTQRMEMRIELQERTRDGAFHAVIAPGFGSWMTSEPGVTIYKYVKQVTNLEAPAAYRAVISFRWLSGRGRLIRHEQLRTARCYEPLPEQAAR